MKKITLLLVSLLLAGAQMLQAQRTITGTVISAEDNQGIPGVSVAVKGTTTGTTTNVMGQYSLNVPSGATTLVFSFMGMETQEVAIDGKTAIDVVMKSGAQALEGVVITGYGVTSKASFTGSAVRVGEEAIMKQSGASVMSNLQGSVPGLQVSNTTGQPGNTAAVQIRGLGSANSGTTPLYVIDGVPVLSGSTTMYATTVQAFDILSSLNPDEIESITTLKDASATSIYGARASNGVIVINTKKGREGKTQITVNAKAGIASPAKLKNGFEPLNASQYTDYLIQSYMAGSGLSEAAARTALKNAGYIETGYETDWWDEVTRNGKLRDVSISASGGTAKTKFFVSGGYQTTEGIIIGTDFKRYSARLNLSNDAYDWLSLGVNASGAYTENHYTATGSSYTSPNFLSFWLRPTEPVYNSDGTYARTSVNGNNPVALYGDKEGNLYENMNYRGTLTPYLRINILKNLVFQTKVGVDILFGDEIQKWSGKYDNNAVGYGGLTQKNLDNRLVQSIVNTVNYTPSFGKHNFNILVGQEAQKFTNWAQWGAGRGFPHPALYELDVAAGSYTAGSNRSWASISSYFSNAEYSTMDRYYLSASFRRDGSSRLGIDKQWGNFYSVGGKWRVTQESFMKATERYINNLTLRASYGTTGNQTVSGGYYAGRGYYAYGYNYNGISGSAPEGVANPNLAWESKNKFNVGFDVLLFDIVGIELDYYNELTKDMIFSVPVSRSSGFSSVSKNVGEMRNKGVEAIVNALIINKKDFKWTMSFNITKNTNKIEKLATDDPIITATRIREEGRAYNTFYLPIWAGVDSKNGEDLWYKKDGTITNSLAQADFQVCGEANPDFYGGFSTKVESYGFDLSISASFSKGGWVLNDDPYLFEHNGSRGALSTNVYNYENSWRPDRTDAKMPQIKWGNAQGGGRSTKWLQPAGYFKIQAITLGYTVPKKYVERAYISNARIYASFENPLIMFHKDFRGFSPETGTDGGNMFNYPQAKTISCGLSITF